MVLKRIVFFGMFIVFTAGSVWGQVVVRDSVEVKQKRPDSGSFFNLLFNSGKGLSKQTKMNSESEYEYKWITLPRTGPDRYSCDKLRFVNFYGWGMYFSGKVTINNTTAKISGSVYDYDPEGSQYYYSGNLTIPLGIPTSMRNKKSFNIRSYAPIFTEENRDGFLTPFLVVTEDAAHFLLSAEHSNHCSFPQSGRFYLAQIKVPIEQWETVEGNTKFTGSRNALNSCLYRFDLWHSVDVQGIPTSDYSHIDIQFSKPVVDYSDTLGISIQPIDIFGQDYDLPSATALTFFQNQTNWGEFLLADGTQQNPVNSIQYGDILNGGIYYIVNGVEPETKQQVDIQVEKIIDMANTICPEGCPGGKETFFIRGKNYLEVYPEKSIINFNEATKVFTEQKTEDPEINLSYGDTISFTVQSDDKNLIHYGYLTLNGIDTVHSVTYQEANYGEVEYIAEFQDFEDDTEVHIIAENYENNLIGMTSIDVVDKKPQLTIITPQNKKIRNITDTPEMPTIECKAKLSGYNEEKITGTQWECKVSYDYPPGSDEVTYTEEMAFDEDFISEWDLDFNDSATIIGGKVKIKVSAEINEKSYSDSLIIYIRGENPDDDDVVNELDAGEIALLETEVPNYSQFDTEYYAVPNERLPLRSDTSRNDQGELIGDLNGWGISQLDDRWHDITTAVLWDWSENLDSGMDYYNQQRDGAENRLENSGHFDTYAEGQTRQSMIDIEGHARYNDGPDGRVWEWVESEGDDEIGYWIRHVTHIDTDTGDRVDATDLEIHNDNYINNYTN
ncbi:MAG: hypothetical protein R6V04_01110 [bacterium]